MNKFKQDILLRAAPVEPQQGVRGGGDSYAGARHRRQYRHLQRHRLHPAGASALPAPGPADAALRRHRLLQLSQRLDSRVPAPRPHLFRHLRVFANVGIQRDRRRQRRPRLRQHRQRQPVRHAGRAPGSRPLLLARRGDARARTASSFSATASGSSSSAATPTSSAAP